MIYIIYRIVIYKCHSAFVLYIAYIFVLEYIWHETTYIYVHSYICVISVEYNSYHRVMRIISIYQNLDLGQESIKNVLTYHAKY